MDECLFTYLTYVKETLPNLSFFRTYAETEHLQQGPEVESDSSSSSSDGYQPDPEESSDF